MLSVLLIPPVEKKNQPKVFFSWTEGGSEGIILHPHLHIISYNFVLKSFPFSLAFSGREIAKLWASTSRVQPWWWAAIWPLFLRPAHPSSLQKSEAPCPPLWWRGSFLDICVASPHRGNTNMEEKSALHCLCSWTWCRLPEIPAGIAAAEGFLLLVGVGCCKALSPECSAESWAEGTNISLFSSPDGHSNLKAVHALIWLYGYSFFELHFLKCVF